MEQSAMQPTLSQTVPAIYKAITGVISDVGYVAKDKVNKQQGFRYRSVDDVFNALHPALAKNKVFIVPQILDREQITIGKTKNGTDMIKVVCRIKFTFYAEDGSCVESVIIGEGLDTGDKATNKAMSIAYKYACFQVFCIPTEEMIDPDAERPEQQLATPKAPSAPPKAPTTPAKAAASKNNAAPENNKVPDKQKEDNLDDSEKITPTMLQVIRNEQERTGVNDQIILSRKGITSKKIEDFTIAEFKYVMDIFQKTPDRRTE